MKSMGKRGRKWTWNPRSVLKDVSLIVVVGKKFGFGRIPGFYSQRLYKIQIRLTISRSYK